MAYDSRREDVTVFESKLALIFQKGLESIQDAVRIEVRSKVYYEYYEKVKRGLKIIRYEDLLNKFLPIGYIDEEQIEKDREFEREHRKKFGKEKLVLCKDGAEFLRVDYVKLLNKRRYKEDCARLVLPIDMILLLPNIEKTLSYTLLSYISQDFSIKLISKDHGIFVYQIEELVGSAQWLIFLLQCAIQEVSFLYENIDVGALHEFIMKVFPWPRKINNDLRTPISYYVKAYGIAAERQFICEFEEDPDELNLKEYNFKGFNFIQNPFCEEIRKSIVMDTFKEHLDCGLSFLKKDGLFRSLTCQDIRILSSYLSFQGLVGFGRSLVSIEDDRITEDNEIRCLSKSMKDSESARYLVKFSKVYKKYWENILDQAAEKALLTPDEESYPFVLKSYAKNTAAGQKATIKIGKKKFILRKKSSVFYYGADRPSQEPFSLGLRSVPVKADRTVYAIPFDIMSQQVKIIGLINRFIVLGGKGTRPTDEFSPAKLIVGDLEATGCRVIDHGDVIRNSSKLFKTLCLDYSDFDRSLGATLFRGIYLTVLKERFPAKVVQDAFGRLLGSRWKPIDQYEIIENSIYEKISPIFKTTHLSGELSTLLANSIYNAAAGAVIRDEIGRCLSEQYVGDDSLMIFDRDVNIDGIRIAEKIASSIYLKISPAKTTFFPFSIEKTQTHAKNGFYVPQDRIQILETERPVPRYGLSSEWFSFYSKMVTKSTRGFSFFIGSMLTSMYYHVGCWVNGSKIFRKIFSLIEDGGLGLFYASFKLPPPDVKMEKKSVILRYPSWMENNPSPREEKSLNVEIPKFYKDNFPKDEIYIFQEQIKQNMFSIFRTEGILKHRYNYRDYLLREKMYKHRDLNSNILLPKREAYEGPFVGFSKDLYFVLNRFKKTNYIKALRSKDPIEAAIGRDAKARCLLNASNFSKVKDISLYFIDKTLASKIYSIRDFSIDIENYGAFSNEFMAMFDFEFSQEQGLLQKEMVRVSKQIELMREHLEYREDTTS